MLSVYISAGSNLGNRESNLKKSIDLISEHCSVIYVSSIYETEPVGKTEQPYFMNAVFRIGTVMLPHCLLKILKGVESEMGRVSKERWGPRIIDLDIVLYGNIIIDTPGLKIPHPEMHDRKFVLEPLCELSPELIHPLLKQDIKTILEHLETDKKTRKIT